MPQIVHVGSKKCFLLSSTPVSPRLKRSMPWIRSVAASSKGSRSSRASSAALGGRTSSMKPSIVISSRSFLSVASAHTRRHAGFGTIVATELCASFFAPRAQLYVGDALEPARDRRPAGRVLVPRLPDAAVGPQAVGVPLDEGGEVLRPDLFLALVQHAHAERELADRRAVRLDHLEPRHEVALVVGDAATEEKAVALGRLERRGRPLLERLG